MPDRFDTASLDSIEPLPDLSSDALTVAATPPVSSPESASIAASVAASFYGFEPRDDDPNYAHHYGELDTRPPDADEQVLDAHLAAELADAHASPDLALDPPAYTEVDRLAQSKTGRRKKPPQVFAYPKRLDAGVSSAKMFASSSEWIARAVRNKEFDSPSDAIRKLVWEAIRYRSATDQSRDQALYFVRKAQEQVVHNGQRHLSRHVSQQSRTMHELTARISEEVTAMRATLDELNRHQTITNRMVLKIGEVATITYGILRHFVLAQMVVRFLSAKDAAKGLAHYQAGFNEQLSEWREEAREENFILDYERHGAHFARALERVTGYDEPESQAEFEAVREDRPPLEFPSDPQPLIDTTQPLPNPALRSKGTSVPRTSLHRDAIDVRDLSQSPTPSVPTEPPPPSTNANVPILSIHADDD